MAQRERCIRGMVHSTSRSGRIATSGAVMNRQLRWTIEGFALPALLMLQGCGSQPLPELNPDAFVASSESQGWSPSSSATQALQPGDGMSLPLAGIEAMSFAPEGTQSLISLVDFSLSNRPETRAAWERARVAAAQLGMVRAQWYPTFGIEADLSFQRIIFPASGSAFFIEQGMIEPSLNLNYLLLDFGRRKADDDRVRAMLWAANLQYDRILQQTIHDVQVGYFQLDAAIAMKKAAERNLDLAVTVVDMIEDRMAMGLATMPELLLARQDLAQARFDLEATVAGISVARSDLLFACGLPATMPIDISPITDEQLPDGFNVRVEEVINQALSRRPDLAASVAKVRAADAAVARAEAEFMPQVSAYASLGGAFTRFQTQIAESRNPAVNQTYPWTNASTDTWAVGLGGSWMIFEGYQRENAVRAARASRREAEELLRGLRLAVISETWDAFFSVQAASRQYEFGIALLESSQEAYDAIEAAYIQGLATITELVEAEKDLQAARSTLVNTRADLLVASSNLTFAAGTDHGQWMGADANGPVAAGP